MANTVSENMRKLRLKKGISQNRLSKDVDLALNAVVEIETGESPQSYCGYIGKNSQSPRRASGRII